MAFGLVVLRSKAMSGVQRMDPALVIEAGHEGGTCCCLPTRVGRWQAGSGGEGAGTSLGVLIK